MLPAIGRTLHVHSANVLIDGVPAPASLLVAELGGRVLAIDPKPHEVPGNTPFLDLGARLVAPAPLDLHFHGAGGHVVPPDGDPASIDDVLAAAVAKAGWSGPGGSPVAYDWVATLPVPATPPHDPVRHVAECARAIAEAGPASGCVGIRIEGLFLNPARAGVWPPDTFRPPDPALLLELSAAARDGGSRLLIVDVAPELPGALELVGRCVEEGIVASIAHTDATWEAAVAAIDAGARLATHTWNAMRPTSHRDPGVVAAVLADRRVTCELICDGVHLHPGTVALSIAACGPGGWVAVSDASPFAGCEPGQYAWAGTTVTHDGVALRGPRGQLAGSASLLDVAWSRLHAAGARTIDVAAALGATPRRVLDPSRSRGIEVGDPAWIVDLA